MSVYMVSYNLSSRDDYEDLFSTIRQNYEWWQCLDSLWLVSTEDEAVVISNTLEAYLGSGDTLFVARLAREANWVGMDEKCAEWIVEKL